MTFYTPIHASDARRSLMRAFTPLAPAFRRRVVHALIQDFRIAGRIIELRRLAEETASGDVPAPDDDPLQQGDRQ